MSDDLGRGSRRAPRVKRELGSAGASDAGRAGGEGAGDPYAAAAAASLAKRDKRCACLYACGVLGLLRLGESRLELACCIGFGYLVHRLNAATQMYLVFTTITTINTTVELSAVSAVSLLHSMLQTGQSDRQTHLCLGILLSASAACCRDRCDADCI